MEGLRTLIGVALAAVLGVALAGSTASDAPTTVRASARVASGTVTPVRVVPGTPVEPGGSRVLTAPAVVTLADNGDTVLLPVGGHFQLQLGGNGAIWHAQVSPVGLLAGPSGVDLSGPATYSAQAVGTATLLVDGGPACLRAAPPCLPPEMAFQLTVVVTAGGSGGAAPATGNRGIVEGTVESVNGDTVQLQLPNIYPVCKPGQPCPMFVALGRKVQVDLGAATFDNTQGLTVAAPRLQAGDTLMAAGRWQASVSAVLEASVAAVVHQAGSAG